MVGLPAGRLWRLSRTSISFRQELRLVPLSFSQHKLVRQVKAELGLAVTLSVGEVPREHYVRWREAGADRFLLRLSIRKQNRPMFYARRDSWLHGKGRAQ